MDLLSILDGTPEPPIVALQLGDINTSGEYSLATPVFEFQKELTDQIVSLHYPDILKYCETDDTKEIIKKSLEICVENCSLVATHPYFLIKHYMPKNLVMKDLPAKLAETSGKFSVLKNLMNVIIGNRSRAGEKHVAVVLRNNSRMFDLVEALLLGCTGPKSIVRYVGNNVKKDSGKASKYNMRDPQSTTIHLVPSDGLASRKDNDLRSVKFDVVVALDSSVDTKSEFLTKLRHQRRLPIQLPAVVIRLVPMLSIEHCLMHYEEHKNDKSYLYNLISAIVCLRDQIGNLPPDLIPIYNQNLTYLSHTFFDQALSENNRTFPAWPLPEPRKIPNFSPSDVERSLLTEVTYHYTPYDSADSNGGSVPSKKRSYYETKRLQSDYETNPLRNDYNTLSGIHNHHAKPENRKKDAVLTHLLISQLNVKHIELAVLMEELKSYKVSESQEKQQSIGRRVDEIKKTLAAIMEDVDHSQQRLQVTERKIGKRTSENEELTETQKRLKGDIAGFAENSEFKDDPLRTKFIRQQLKTWDLQHDVKGLVSALKLRGDDKNYMKKEIANCEESVAQSEAQIAEVGSSIRDMNTKIDTSMDQNARAKRTFQLQRSEILARLDAAQNENKASKAKLAKALAYLKETSHFKKRKGRTLTPNAR